MFSIAIGCFISWLCYFNNDLIFCSTDYDSGSIPPSITFQPDDFLICFNVTIINDLIALEPDETIILTLSYFNGSRTDTSTVTIIDDDCELLQY